MKTRDTAEVQDQLAINGPVEGHPVLETVAGAAQVRGPRDFHLIR